MFLTHHSFTFNIFLKETTMVFEESFIYLYHFFPPLYPESKPLGKQQRQIFFQYHICRRINSFQFRDYWSWRSWLFHLLFIYFIQLLPKGHRNQCAWVIHAELAQDPPQGFAQIFVLLNPPTLKEQALIEYSLQDNNFSNSFEHLLKDFVINTNIHVKWDKLIGLNRVDQFEANKFFEAIGKLKIFGRDFEI